MHHQSLWPIMLLLSLSATHASGQGVSINEFWTDDYGNDDAEYVELYSHSGADLDGLELLVIDGDTGGDRMSVNYGRVTLRVRFEPFTRLDPGARFLIGSGTVSQADLVIPERSLQNNSQTFALVRSAVVPPVVVGEDLRLSDAVMASMSGGVIDAVAVLDGHPEDHVYLGAITLPTNPAGHAWDVASRTNEGGRTGSPDDWALQDNFALRIELGDSNDRLATPGWANGTSTGACCLAAGGCVTTSEIGCVGDGGQYLGNGSSCVSGECGTAACLCEMDGFGEVDVLDLLLYLDCWFDASRTGCSPP